MPGLFVNTLPDGVTPINGVSVQSTDGATTIIDGTTDVFKIAASGTTSETGPGVDGLSQLGPISLPGLGTLSACPALICYANDGNTAGDNHFPSADFGTSAMYAAASAGGSPNQLFAALGVVATMSINLSGTSTGTVQLWVWMTAIAALTEYFRYYVLVETAF